MNLYFTSPYKPIIVIVFIIIINITISTIVMALFQYHSALAPGFEMVDINLIFQ